MGFTVVFHGNTIITTKLEHVGDTNLISIPFISSAFLCGFSISIVGNDESGGADSIVKDTPLRPN